MKYIAAILAVAAAIAPAYAATPAPQAPAQQTTQSQQVSFTGWRLECDPVKATLACHALDQIVSATNGSQIIGFNLSPTPDGKTILTMTVPLGTSVRTAVGVSVAGGPSQSFPFLTCLAQQGCFATAPINADLLAAMREGKGDLHVTYAVLDNGLNEHQVTASLPLAGFSAVYDRLK
jgi:invasion protein IalB